MYALVLSLFLPSVSDLGADEWEDRERAEQRFRDAGPLAWDILARASGAEDAEIRFRVQRLLRGAKEWQQNWRAIVLLGGAHEPTEAEIVQIFGDDLFRRRLHKIALDAGLSAHFTDYLHPDRDQWSFWSCAPIPWFHNSLASCRQQLR